MSEIPDSERILEMCGKLNRKLMETVMELVEENRKLEAELRAIRSPIQNEDKT